MASIAMRVTADQSIEYCFACLLLRGAYACQHGQTRGANLPELGFHQDFHRVEFR